MNTEFKIKLHNRFDAVVTDTKTNEIKQIAKAENVVLNGYWDETFVNISNYYLWLVLGTGTGTPAITDTRLFQFLGCRNLSYSTTTTSRVGAHEWKREWVMTFTENQAIGELSEVGLARGSSGSIEWGTSSTYINRYYTHAIFTDAEGHPITITKTNADRLTITATVFLTLNWSTAGPVYPSINIRTPGVSCDPRLDYVTGDAYATGMIALWLLHNSLIDATFTYYSNTLPIRYLSNATSMNQSTSYSSDASQLTCRNYAYSRILSTTGNALNYSTFIIRCVYNTYAFVSLPNAAVYPSKLLSLTAIGDGAVTEFNFDIPILNTNNVKVYVNDVLQSNNSYTFNGNNFKHPQGWGSCDTLYLSRVTWYTYTGSGTAIYNALGPIIYYKESTNTTNIDSIATYYYDFQTSYTVSAVGKCMPSSSSFQYNRGVPRLYYSTDNENWIQIDLPDWSTISKYLAYGNIDSQVISITPVSARYWKVEQPLISVSDYVATGYFWASILFGDPSPQLKFNTAPPAESTIRLEAYCDYPIKNSNWIVENSMTFDYTFTRQ